MGLFGQSIFCWTNESLKADVKIVLQKNVSTQQKRRDNQDRHSLFSVTSCLIRYNFIFAVVVDAVVVVHGDPSRELSLPV